MKNLHKCLYKSTQMFKCLIYNVFPTPKLCNYLSRYELPKIIYLKTRHIYKSCNIYLKLERFSKPKFILSKVN